MIVQAQPFKHLLYQFGFAHSGWCSVMAVQGDESNAALAAGLQRALHQTGGGPIEHHIDSLSATRNNRKNVWTGAYSDLCENYNKTPIRNNFGLSHESGIVITPIFY